MKSSLHIKIDSAQKAAIMAEGGSEWARWVLEIGVLLDLDPRVLRRIAASAETPLARRLLSEALAAVAP
jgi:hypothetical protein